MRITMQRRSRWPWAARSAAVLGGILLLAAGPVAFFLKATGVRNPDRFDSLIRQAASRHGVDPCLIKAVVWRESRFDPGASGRFGEVGLMQICLPAATDWSRSAGVPVVAKGQLYDPALNIEIGSWYLARALERWSGYAAREALALAEYNAGGAKARGWAPADPKDAGMPNILNPNTQKYVTAVLDMRRKYENEGAFGR